MAGPYHSQFAYSQAPTSTLARPTLTPPGTPAEFGRTGARPIHMDRYVEGKLRPGRWEVWAFDASADDIVTITLNSVRFDAFLELYLSGDSRHPLATDDDGGLGYNAKITEFMLPVTGTYYIYARSFDDAGEGEYRLHLNALSNLDTNPDLAVMTRYGAVEHGKIEAFHAVYAFEGESGDQVTIAVEANAFDSTLYLTDSTGLLIAENDDNERGEKHAALTNIPLEFSDTYYVFVMPFEPGKGGPFTLALYETSQVMEAPGGEIETGDTLVGELTPNTFADWRFEGEADDVVSLTAVADPPQARVDLTIELYGPEGALLDGDNDSGLLLNPAIIDYTLPEDGEYRIRVMEAAPLLGGHYKISLAEGRTYFGPDGHPARLHFWDDGNSMTPVTKLDAKSPFDVWLVSGIPAVPFTVELETSGGSASLDDFIIRVADTDWAFLTGSAVGEVTVEEPAVGGEYLVLIEYTGLSTLDYQLKFIP